MKKLLFHDVIFTKQKGLPSFNTVVLPIKLLTAEQILDKNLTAEIPIQDVIDVEFGSNVVLCN